MRLPCLVLTLCLPLPLVAGCPGDEGPDGGAGSTTAPDPASTGEDSTTDPGPGAPADTDTTDDTDTTADTDATADTDTTAGTDTTADTEGTVPGCECIVDETEEGYASPAAPTCGEALCPDVRLDCDDDTCSEAHMVADPDALSCALTALRDRTPGLVTWSFSENSGQFDQDGYILIQADGSAVRRDWGQADIAYDVSDAELGMLPAPEHYDACIADAPTQAAFECLRDGLEQVVEVCDEGWYVEDI